MTADQFQEGSKNSPLEKSERKDYATGDKAANFSELTRIAKESKSAWPEISSVPKSERNFLLLIVIAVILISGITLIVGYRTQLSANLVSLSKELGEVRESLFSITGNTTPPKNISSDSISKTAALEFQLTVLKAKVGQLKARIAELEAAAQTQQKNPASALTNKASPATDQSIPVDSRLVPSSPAPVSPSSIVTTIAPKAVQPVFLETKEKSKSLTNSSTPKNMSTAAPVATRPPKVPPQKPGLWFINIGTFSDRASAEKLLAKVQVVLKNSVLQTVNVDNRSLHRIRAIGYQSNADAKNDAQRLKSELGLGNTWIAGSAWSAR